MPGFDSTWIHGEIGLRHHPGIAHEHATPQLPALQLVLHPPDDGDVDRIAREDPVTDREAVAGDGEPDHDLRRVEAPVLRVPLLPERAIVPAARRHVLCT